MSRRSARGSAKEDAEHVKAWLWDAGIALDLAPYLERDPRLSADDFVPWAISSFSRRSGEVYALVQNISIRSPVANLSMIREAGLPSPNELTPEEWNWERLEEYGRRLTVIGPDGALEVAGVEWSEAYTPTLVRQAGGFLFDHPAAPERSGLLRPETVAALETWVSWYHPNPIALRSRALRSGTVGIAVETSVEVGQLVNEPVAFDWDVILWPTGPLHNGHEETVGGPLVLRNVSHPQMAYELAKYMTTDVEAALGLIRVLLRAPGYLPNLGLFSLANFPEGAPPGVEHYRTMILNPNTAATPGFSGYPRFRAEYERLLREEGITGRRPVRSILEALNVLAENILSELR